LGLVALDPSWYLPEDIFYFLDGCCAVGGQLGEGNQIETGELSTLLVLRLDLPVFVNKDNDPAIIVRVGDGGGKPFAADDLAQGEFSGGSFALHKYFFKVRG